jgi:hypothetical protein
VDESFPRNYVDAFLEASLKSAAFLLGRDELMEVRICKLNGGEISSVRAKRRTQAERPSRRLHMWFSSWVSILPLTCNSAKFLFTPSRVYFFVLVYTLFGGK